MKTISIIRHAKSSWGFPELDDFDRPLRNKGIKRTRKICGYLKKNLLFPDLIVSSKARRAIDTAKLICQDLGLDAELIKKEEQFYPGNSKAFLQRIRGLDDKCNHVALVGHNPSITDVVNQMVINKVIEWIPTSGVVIMTNNANQWSTVDWNEWELKNYLIPKQILNTYE